MHVVWVELEVLPNKLEQFKDAITANAHASVRDEPGCLSFDVVELDSERRRYAFYEVYRDRNAFTVEHRSAAHYAAWRIAVAATVVPGSQTITEGTHVLAGAS